MSYWVFGFPSTLPQPRMITVARSSGSLKLCSAPPLRALATAALTPEEISSGSATLGLETQSRLDHPSEAAMLAPGPREVPSLPRDDARLGSGSAGAPGSSKKCIRAVGTAGAFRTNVSRFFRYLPRRYARSRTTASVVKSALWAGKSPPTR